MKSCLLLISLVLFFASSSGALQPLTLMPNRAQAQANEAQDTAAGKKELLGLIDKLKSKVPSELARKLSIISMKLSTGYCSPFLTKEFEEEINKLPEKEQQKFEKEWKRVREHNQWPRMPKKGKPTRPEGEASPG
jgi:hypothetical protein